MQQQQIARILNEGEMDSLDEIVVKVKRNPLMVEMVMAGLSSDDPFIRWRAAYAAEKISKKYSAYLQPYKNLLVEHALDDQPDVRILLIQLLPRLSLDEQERVALFEKLQIFLAEASDMLKIVSLQTLVTLAENDASLHSQMMALLERQASGGIPANQSLAKYQLARVPTSIATPESQLQKRTSFRERRQRGASMFQFSNQFMHVAEDHYGDLRKQIQERDRQAIPSKNTILKEIKFLVTAICGLVLCITFISSLIADPIDSFASPTSYLWGVPILILGFFSLWMLIDGIKNLVRMQRRLSQAKRIRETEE